MEEKRNSLMTPDDKYQNDPSYKRLVDIMMSFIAEYQFSPSELREAAVMASIRAVDTQKNGFFYEIRAWGWGSDLESWQVREGYVGTFEALYKTEFTKPGA